MTFVTFVTTNQTVQVLLYFHVRCSGASGVRAFLTQLGYDTINLKKSNHFWTVLHIERWRRFGFGVLGFSTVPNSCTIPQFRGLNIHEIIGELELGKMSIFQHTVLHDDLI